MEGYKLKLLRSKSEVIFQRLTKLYDQSKKVVCTADTRSTENFMADSEMLDEMRHEFISFVDNINQLNMEINPDYEPDFNDLVSFEDIYTRIKRVRNNINSAKQQHNIPTTSSQPVKSIVKLPPIVIPSFDGKPENWPMFYESFKANIHNNPQLSDSQRVQYLIGKLTHNALQIVAGIVPTGETYSIIWNSLVKKYQDKRSLGTFYLNNIFELKNCFHSANSLNSFIEKFSASIAAIKQLDIPDLTDFILLHFAIKRLDIQTVQSFELSVRDTEIPTCEELISFVQDQVKILERSGNNNNFSQNRNSSSISNKNQNISKFDSKSRTLISHNNQITKTAPCVRCNSTEHLLFNCRQFKEISSPQERYEFIKSKNCCVNCLSSSHSVKACNSRHVCNFCQKKHHTLLHFNNNNLPNNNSTVQLHTFTRQDNKHNSQVYGAPVTYSQPSVDDAKVGFAMNASSQQSVAGVSAPYVSDGVSPAAMISRKNNESNQTCTTILLSTAQVYAYHKYNNKKIIRLLLDNGSQNNLITLKCCKLLNLPVIPLYNSSLRGVGLSSRPIHGYVYLTIESRVSSNKYYIHALVVDCITEKLPAFQINSREFDCLNKVPLADLTWNIPGNIDMVIGAQLFPYIYLGDRLNSNASAPPAFLTTFDNILMGDFPSSFMENNCPASFAAITLSNMESCLHKFWELEEIPNKRFMSPDETECENLFTGSVTRDTDGRYTVSLPFSRNPADLGNSRSVAHRRFLALERKLKHTPAIREDYNKVIADYLQNGYLSEVSSTDNESDGYYIPHHAVIRQDKVTTKLRIVLDASAKTHTGLSLNDVLHSGPNLQADLFLLLLDFRLYPIALTADIKQMYLQINLLESQRKYVKILFRFNENEKLRTFHFNRVPFGLKSSPFLAMRTVRQLATDEGNRFPDAASIAQSKLYMDDLVTSVSDEGSAICLAKELITLFKSGCFDLVKWASNSSALLDSLPHSHLAPVNFSDDASNNLKILGLSWIHHEDVFLLTTSCVDDKCTKRTILSFIARLFDVLGLVSPVIVYAKLLIKDLWISKVDWDDTPPEHIVKCFSNLVKELPLLSKIKIPRHIGVHNNCTVNLVAFCDASLKAYGCVIYLHITDEVGNIVVRLLCSKSKVSPVKISTLARLELCAAVLMSRLVRIVLDTYRARTTISGVYTFSDSTIALSWVHSFPHKWSIFVSNRIAQFQENLNPQNIYHVSGAENPCDCLSRGLLPSQLIDHDPWWNGPTWMRSPPDMWPIQSVSITSCEQLPEFKSNTLTTTVQNTPPILYERFKCISSWNKLLRVIVYVLRFVKKLPLSKVIVASDLNIAEKTILRSVQKVHFQTEIDRLKKNDLPSKHFRHLCPFIDEDGILRIEGRLSKSDLPFECKHPVLLPKRDHVVDLLIDYHHKLNLHTGASLLMSILRQRYWILSARNIIRKRVHQESSLADYLKTSAKMCHGLTTKQVRELAYQYAVRLELSSTPSSWNENNMASLDWLKGFLKRNDSLSVRKPENTSLARTTSFNRHNVQNFFCNLEKCYLKHEFPANMIWNLDETGCTTVTNTPKIVAQAGAKRVGQISSTERGSLVTMLAFANAAGGSIPPVFIFPRVRFKEHMLESGPTGALGLANLSGCITEECFLKALKHFVGFVKPTAESPALIVLDNHNTHITINVVLYARTNNLIILTFPPHCSHRLQPLDLTVFGPFKARYRASMNDWMTSNPGETVTIYNVAQFARDAFYAAFSMNNITSGFKNSGIWPINKNIFTDEDFLPAFVTDRPEPLPNSTDCDENSSNEEELQHVPYPIEPNLDFNKRIVSPSILDDTQTAFCFENEPQLEVFYTGEPQPEPSNLNTLQAERCNTEQSNAKASNFSNPPITPETIRPYPKAPPRKSIGRQRKGKTTIITETPEKDRLLLENMLDILKKNTPKADKQNLKHVKQIFKCNLKDQESKRTKGKGKAKKNKIESNKSVKTSQKKKPSRKFVASSSSDDSSVNMATDSDSIDNISETEEVCPRLRNRSLRNDKTGDDNQCNVWKHNAQIANLTARGKITVNALYKPRTLILRLAAILVT
ncbi:uncharacterized protein LOC113500286 [Trichoplusia ni]|uniref:Uncharacterized protein LOC113500286 n=1 Tax=Trichoplusia ni TaxID=7111 RepID=A0A7E5W842_TRINI|nr:uncharacterized protein LOC113500286 [Trichoplusia ni]